MPPSNLVDVIPEEKRLHCLPIYDKHYVKLPAHAFIGTNHIHLWDTTTSRHCSHWRNTWNCSWPRTISKRSSESTKRHFCMALLSVEAPKNGLHTADKWLIHVCAPAVRLWWIDGPVCVWQLTGNRALDKRTRFVWTVIAGVCF